MPSGSPGREPGRRVLVVGGGLAGVTCALTLAKAGADVVLLEAAPRLGGRWGTPRALAVAHAGQCFDLPLEHGVHALWPQYHNLHRLLATHGLSGQLQHRSEQSLAFVDAAGRPALASLALPVLGRNVPELVSRLAALGHPLLRRAALADGPRRLLRTVWELSHALAFRADAGAATSAADRHYDDLRVADYVQDWPPVLVRLLTAATHAAFFRDPGEVSLAAFLAALDAYALRDVRDAGFDLLRADPERTVFDPLAAALRAACGEIRLGTRVEALTVQAGRAVGVQLAGGEHLPAAAVALAVDAPAFAHLGGGEALGVRLDTHALGAPSVVVRLFYDRALGLRPDRPATGFFAGGDCDCYFWLDRLLAAGSVWAEATGGTLLECHLYGCRAVWAATAADAAVVERVSRAIEPTWPGLVGRRVAADVQRNPPTQTSFPPGAWSRLPGVTTPVPNVALCGDWIACPDTALSLERATATGVEAARVLAGAVGLDTTWMPAPLALDPPALSLSALRAGLRALRSRGHLPPLEHHSPR